MDTDPSKKGDDLRVEGRLHLPRRFSVAEWVAEENAKGHFCACGCGRKVPVLPSHRKTGIPRYLAEHRPNLLHNEVGELRARGFMTGREVAAELGLARETLLRMAEELFGEVPRLGARGIRVFSGEQIAKLRATFEKKAHPRHDLTNAQWKRVEPLLPEGRADGRGRPRADERAVLNAILWVQRTGARWDALPDRYPPYQTCRGHFARWNADGIWARLVDALKPAV